MHYITLENIKNIYYEKQNIIKTILYNCICLTIVLVLLIISTIIFVPVYLELEDDSYYSDLAYCLVLDTYISANKNCITCLFGVWSVKVNYNKSSINDTSSWTTEIKVETSNNLELVLETKPPGTIHQCWLYSNDKYDISWIETTPDKSSIWILIDFYILSILFICISYLTCIIFCKKLFFKIK